MSRDDLKPSAVPAPAVDPRDASLRETFPREAVQAEMLHGVRNPTPEEIKGRPLAYDYALASRSAPLEQIIDFEESFGEARDRLRDHIRRLSNRELRSMFQVANGGSEAERHSSEIIGSEPKSEEPEEHSAVMGFFKRCYDGFYRTITSVYESIGDFFGRIYHSAVRLFVDASEPAPSTPVVTPTADDYENIDLDYDYSTEEHEPPSNPTLLFHDAYEEPEEEEYVDPQKETVAAVVAVGIAARQRLERKEQAEVEESDRRKAINRIKDEVAAMLTGIDPALIPPGLTQKQFVGEWIDTEILRAIAIELQDRARRRSAA